MKVYFKGWLTVLALALAALVIIILATQPIRAAGPWYVAPGGSDGNDCLSPGTACATINGALGKADPGDTIYVATGTYTSTVSEVVLLDKDATLSGGWDAAFTTQNGTSTIDGQGSRRGMTVNSGVTAIVERFTVSNGDTDGDGGGIANRGTAILNNSTVSGNTAGDDGGGIANSGTLTLNNSTISGNTPEWHGGGIYNDYGTVTLNNSTVSGNGGRGAGGGIYGASTLTLNNSTVSGNTGDGIYYYGHIGGMTLNNSTISGNTGVGISHWSAWTAPVTLQNTILAGNMAGSGPDCSDTIDSAGYNLIGDTSGCTFTPTTGDLTNMDAKLGPLQDNGGPTETHALLPGSPAIDHIPPGNCTVPTDQRGVARPQPAGGNCDIGAYELEQEPTIMVSIDVKPGSDPNSINCNNEKEVIAVAILTTEDFDATTVDHTTVTFEGASETHVDKKSGEPRRHEEDVDGDGDTDLVFHFRLGDTDLTCDSIEGTLTGETFDAQAIKGTDAVRMIERGGGQP